MSIEDSMNEFEPQPEPINFDPVINDVIERILKLEKAYNELTEQQHTDTMTTDLREGLMENLDEEIKYLYNQLQVTWDAIPDLDLTPPPGAADDTQGLYVGDDAFEEVVVVEEPPKTKTKRKSKADK